MNPNDDVRTDIGWGTPAQPAPTPPTPPPPTPPSRPGAAEGWVIARRALLWLVLALGVAGIGLGLYAVAEDLSETSDMFHGLGIAIGVALALLSLLLCVLAGLGLRSMRRRGPEGGRPHAVAIGVLLLLLALLLVGFSPVMLLPALPGAALIASVAARGSRRP